MNAALKRHRGKAMSLILCFICGNPFNTDDDPDCWDEDPNGNDIAICESCRDEEESYENIANPVRIK